jgi:tetratricopeptide (TPR) repeat protein
LVAAVELIKSAFSAASERQLMSDLPADSRAYSHSSEAADASILLRQGVAAHQQEKLDEARFFYEQVLVEQRYNFDALQLLGLIHFSQGSYEKALLYLLEAVQQNPSNPIVHHNTGNVLAKLGRLEEAIFSFDTCLALDPGNGDVHKNKGITLEDLGRDEEALACYDRAIACSPRDADAFYNRGNVLKRFHRFSEAIDSQDAAIDIDPEHNAAYWNKAILLLLRGEYLEGWSLYEWRSRGDDALAKFPSFSQPSWRGEGDISGKRLLIHAEQGFGDLIQFSRYAPMVLSKGAEVILEVPKPLVTVMQTLHPEVSIAVQGEPLPEFDVHCPVMSLPYAFKTTVETVPSSDRYLSADPAKVALWREKLDATSAKRVGLVWSGSATHKNDHNRSIALSDLLPLLDTPCEWHSLQKEYREGDLAVLAGVPQLHQHQDDLIDFSDTAALIECLDLVITVDTSVAHLAGALGKPVWILVPRMPCYRWLLDRTDTPWYPSAQLFRQSEGGEWREVLTEVEDALRLDAGPGAMLVSDPSLGGRPSARSDSEDASIALLVKQGLIAHQLNKLDEAKALYEQVLAKDSTNASALELLGLVHFSLCNYEQSLVYYLEAIQQNPTNPEVHHNIGNVLAELGRLEEAVFSFDTCLALDPNNSAVHRNKGIALFQLDRLDHALESYDQALALGLTEAPVYKDRGVILSKLDRQEEALANYAIAEGQGSLCAQGYHNLGGVLGAFGCVDDALASYNKALSLRPDYQSAHWNKSILLLLRGEYLEGWSLYEWRSRGDDALAKFPSFSQPSWRGEGDISGKRLLIHAEQGFGDLIQFSRYAPMVLSKGAEVILEVPKPLVTVMQTLHPEVSIAVQGEPLPEFDVHCPVMSLPYAFKTTVETVPSSDRYLSADPAKVALWREKLDATSAKRVGLVWSGSATHKNDHNRSIALSDLLPLLDTPCEWHSLQKEYREGDLAVLEGVPQLHQHQDDLIDFSDTAALIECLDLVITVDTSVAHLAGAMGKPVWILLPTRPDFRWMLDRTDTPWYPSAQLFRQSEAGDWLPLIKRLADELKINTAGFELNYKNVGSQSLNESSKKSAADDSLDALSRRAAALHFSNELHKAQCLYEYILHRNARHFDALQLLADVYARRGEHSEAIMLYERALLVCQTNAAVYLNRGVSLRALGRLQEAISSYTKAISLKPDYSDAHCNLGNILKQLESYDAALASYESAICYQPSNANAHLNYGLTLAGLQRYDEALAAFNELVRLQPDDCRGYGYKGTIFHSMGRLDDAMRAYDQALHLTDDQCGNGLEHICWNKSILLLLRGEYLEGWSLYEWRSKGDDAPVKFPSFSQPSWRGEGDISGKRLLIHAEQGFGDLIQFSRYAPMVLSKGAEVILEVPKPLVTVMQTLHPEVSIAVQGEPLPEFDVHCPVMSLPYAFKTTVETVPSSDRYLSADPAKVALWQEKLGETSAKRVGLVWSGSATHKNDHNRSMALSDLLPLLDTPCEWHSLQKEYREGDLAVLEGVPQLHQHQDDLIDFSDTAALIECLDLVITVDTSVAHLAGAMGKPVWILLPALPDFRWMLDRSDTPWYPSAQLFRQSEAGNWGEALTRVDSALRLEVCPSEEVDRHG